MHVLLLRPVPGNERFGLGPFFRIEPLGMEYIAAALEARGHSVTLADLRFSRSAEHQLRATRPSLVGIAAMHALETDDVMALAGRVRAVAPDVPIVIGGHTAAAYPQPFLMDPVAAVVQDDGERALPRIADALQRGGRLRDVPGIVVREPDGAVVMTAADSEIFALDDVPLPARHLVARWRRQYACLAHRPTWLIETARGCPFRCSFCSIWQLHSRSVRERSIDAVCRDFASAGDHIFIADDLFWYQAPRSLALARELRRRGIRKRWILVQSRVDLVARSVELLEAWKPLAEEFDIFFGLEAATNEGLSGLKKDATVDQTARGVEVARALGYGVTGNFVIDPGMARGGFRTPVGVRRAPSSVPGRFYDSDAAAGDVVLRGDAAAGGVAALVALRHAPSALGAGARARAVLRAVLRDVAPLGAESARPQEPLAVDARGRPEEYAVPRCARCAERSD